MNRKIIYIAYLLTFTLVIPAWSAASIEQISNKLRLLQQIRGQSISAVSQARDKQYQPERDEPLKINPRLAAELPEKHRLQQERDQTNLDNAKALANKFVSLAAEIVADIDEVVRENTDADRFADGYKSMIINVKNQLRPDVGLYPAQYADADKVQALQSAIDKSTDKFDKSIARNREKEKVAQRAKEVEDGAGQLILLYVMADACYQAGQNFNTKELEGVKSDVTRQLDALSISKQKRDEQWNAAQFGMQQSGLKNLPARQLAAECNSLRGNMTYAFPEVFIRRDQLPKNPF